ncbi:hypothetical protein SRABI83_01256 [Arthrobacter sp. Bi83]|uniref:hypothetical protein n=1 Tax=Arthrobacter sp. Bi83 TaxID=2822353 RepID=UPI001D99DD44|nr:hypothetical protein [Arthrobacter sp. Bi83]CAH0173911.1 hypothetical protein SRABI83_01256 [Arthrobacter sp. Bi83]
MNRPDSNSSDPSANQDDAVWLDLVARLEADTAFDPETRNQNGAGSTPAADSTGAAGGTMPGSAAESPAKHFTDFDPLGLAPRAGAPTELSAAERQEAAARQRAAENAPPGSGAPGSAGSEGPRDYGMEDDDGAFVPEEPPSLSATDPLTMLAWIGAVGAPVALVLSAMFWRSAPLLAILGMVVTFVGAVVYLIMKLPQDKDENDDGARV